MSLPRDPESSYRRNGCLAPPQGADNRERGCLLAHRKGAGEERHRDHEGESKRVRREPIELKGGEADEVECPYPAAE